MLATDPQFKKVASALRKCRHAIAVTGAGLSTPSGIPDFRSVHGLWAKFDIMEYGTISAFRADPYKVWKLFKEIGSTVHPARPNPGHVALARLEELGLLKAVVTQNIDGLHQMAGSTEVIEFHGSASSFTCLKCYSEYSRAQADKLGGREEIPHCECGYPLKPDIILFGESIPERSLQDSFALAEASDLILVVGTSAEVAPASILPSVVDSRGGKVVEANISHTQLSSMAAWKLKGDASKTLPVLVEAVEELL